MDHFLPAVSRLCVAAGPPSASFTLADIDAALSSVAATPAVYAAVFSAVDTRMSGALSATPLSVRLMLWTLLCRLCVVGSAPAEWAQVLAPQLYRVVMLVAPKAEDATENVAPVRKQLRRWMAAAEGATASTGGAVPAAALPGTGVASASSTAAAAAPLFKHHHLLNSLRYIESYRFEPPPPSAEAIAASKERRRERKAQRRRLREQEDEAEREEKKRRRGAARAGKSNDSTGRSRSPSAGGAEQGFSPERRSLSPSSGASSPQAPSPASPSDASASIADPGHRYRNRQLSSGAAAPSASAEAASARWLEQNRAQQKVAQLDQALRAFQTVTQAGWEEMEETLARVRARMRAERAEAATVDGASGLSTSPSPSCDAPVARFLRSWLAPRNHWQSRPDSEGSAWDAPATAATAQHPLTLAAANLRAATAAAAANGAGAVSATHARAPSVAATAGLASKSALGDMHARAWGALSTSLRGPGVGEEAMQQAASARLTRPMLPLPVPAAVATVEYAVDDADGQHRGAAETAQAAAMAF